MKNKQEAKQHAATEETHAAQGMGLTAFNPKSKIQNPKSLPSWRSLAELADDEEFQKYLKAEFPSAAEPEGVDRRRWLQLMGASLAMAGAIGCRWEKREILPAATRAGQRVPGVPQRFATAMDVAGNVQGLLVTCVDGRPIKVEGNPDHPVNAGATDVMAQAAILQLYDPDRSSTVIERTERGATNRTWDEFAEFAHKHFEGLRRNKGAGFRILAEANSSPTLLDLRRRLLKASPEAAWYEYEPLSDDNQIVDAPLQSSQPVPSQPYVYFDKARVIVALDSDLFGDHPDAVQNARLFAKGRKPGNAMNRLYAIEGCYTITGAMADHRLPLSCSEIASFAAMLEGEVKSLVGVQRRDRASPNDASTPDTPHALTGRATQDDPATAHVVRFARAMAEDLVANRDSGLVVVGRGQPPEVHATAYRINLMLDKQHQAVTWSYPGHSGPSHVEAIKALVAEMAASKVDTLLILGGNPVYNAPADLSFAKALAKVPTRIHLSLYADETSEQCTWHLPQAHFLESWGDVKTYDDVYSVVQPTIEPLFGGKSAIELLSLILDPTPAGAEESVRTTLGGLLGAVTLAVDRHWKFSEADWARALTDGMASRVRASMPRVLGFDEVPQQPKTPLSAAAPRFLADRPNGQLEIIFYRSAAVYDGRFANNGWLQEMPDPMTRLTWDNAALISPATAKKLGVEDGTIVRLKFDGRELEIPAYVMPGQAADTVAVALGYGRTAAGHVGGLASAGIAPVGVDAYRLRTTKAMYFGTGLTVEPTGRKYELAATQNHHVIDNVGDRARRERAEELVQEWTLADCLAKAKSGAKGNAKGDSPIFAETKIGTVPAKIGTVPVQSDEGHRWGMAIDLSKCTGCSACVIACQAENNVPVVGKTQVLRGREMHWIRVDRYFRGDANDPAAAHQPVPCMQCENAPCEQVCPVAATVHTKEGLNDMVYNRCVGTRYCSNNCPFKVRRFNFFNYHKFLEDEANEVAKMAYNPEVTIRHRGVMEKCTYCVQRIQAVKITAKNQRRPIADGEIKTACQQACPAQAIVFGDLADDHSEVARAHRDQRAYGLLPHLDVRPRTLYLAKVRNPNPKLKDEPS